MNHNNPQVEVTEVRIYTIPEDKRAPGGAIGFAQVSLSNLIELRSIGIYYSASDRQYRTTYPTNKAGKAGTYFMYYEILDPRLNQDVIESVIDEATRIHL